RTRHRKGYGELHAIRHLLGLCRADRGARGSDQSGVRRRHARHRYRWAGAAIRRRVRGDRDRRSRPDVVGPPANPRLQHPPMNVPAPFVHPIGEHDPDALYFLPLGGAGEIGMNLSLYGYRGQWLIVDCGVTFGEEEHQPGVDVIMADPAFIVERRDQLLGIVATHAHEDHIGAIPYLWPQLRCPVWATPFTAAVLRAKLVEARLVDQVEINTVPMSGRFTIGPF